MTNLAEKILESQLSQDVLNLGAKADVQVREDMTPLGDVGHLQQAQVVQGDILQRRLVVEDHLHPQFDSRQSRFEQCDLLVLKDTTRGQDPVEAEIFVAPERVVVEPRRPDIFRLIGP